MIFAVAAVPFRAPMTAERVMVFPERHQIPYLTSRNTQRLLIHLHQLHMYI